MSVKVTYKGEEILSLNTDTEKALATEGQYCEGDIIVENTQDGGITPSGSITLTEENTYDVTDKASAVVDFSATRAGLAEAVTAKGVDTLPTASFDTIATNIGLIEGGGGSLPPSISKITEGEFTLAVDTICNAYNVEHGLGVAPKFVLIWSDEMLQFQEGATQHLVYYSASRISIQTSTTATDGGLYLAGYRQNNGSFTRSNSAVTQAQVTTQFGDTTFTTGINVRYKAGKKYKWIAWA